MHPEAMESHVEWIASHRVADNELLFMLNKQLIRSRGVSVILSPTLYSHTETRIPEPNSNSMPKIGSLSHKTIQLYRNIEPNS